MATWIFKQSNQELYPDELGRTYVYDNRHSVRVARDDSFIYLDKRGGSYAFTGHGIITNVQWRTPGASDIRHPRINRVYTATLGDYIEYSRPLDIRTTSKTGRENRAALGVIDVNKIGWSISIVKLHSGMFERIVDLAYRQQHIQFPTILESSDYEVSDAWSYVRTRHSLERFKKTILRRQGYICAICGTTLGVVLEVAHISSYSSDVKNRANPANGIGLCVFCHRAFDRGVFLFNENGVVSLAKDIGSDPVIEAHLSHLSSDARLKLLTGVDQDFLRTRLLNGPTH